VQGIYPKIPPKYHHFKTPVPTAIGSVWDKGYRYGFNGKEKDKGSEGMGGGGSTYDYGFRIYNPNLVKFLSVDPLTASYPWYTPYQFSGNMPINAIDLDGLEESKPEKPSFNTKIQVPSIDDINIVLSSVNSLMNDAWVMSNVKYREHGGSIIVNIQTGEIKVHRFRKAKGLNSGSINLTPTRRKIPKGYQSIGDFHTHPYSPKDRAKNSLNENGEGVPFSWNDIQTLPKIDGFISIVDTGSKRFVVQITNIDDYNNSINSQLLDEFLDDVDILAEKKKKDDKELKYDEALSQSFFDTQSKYNEEGKKLGITIYETQNDDKTKIKEESKKED
jgi:RHS repeat-associated protein